MDRRGRVILFTGTRGGKGDYTFNTLHGSHLGEQLGDYGSFTNCGSFCWTGSVFDDIRPLISDVEVVPMQHKVSLRRFRNIKVVDELGLSLPSSRTFNPSLAPLSARLTNAFLVTSPVRCAGISRSYAHMPCDGWLD